MLVVFDIDGTLCGEEKDRIRPGARKLIHTLREHKVSVALWTAGNEERLKWFLRAIECTATTDDPFLFTWSGSRCTRKADLNKGIDYYHWAAIRKPLKKVWVRYKREGFNRRNTVVVDNNPHTYALNYGNGIPIPTFSGYELKDSVLTKLLPSLIGLASNLGTAAADVRILLKKRDFYLTEKKETETNTD